MSNTQDRGNTNFSRFDTMTDEELEEILRLDAQNIVAEESDTDMLLYVMEVLAEREKDQFQPTKFAEDAFQSFRKNYFPLEGPINGQKERSTECITHKSVTQKHRWLHRAVLAVAMIAVVFLTSISAKAFGFDFWGTLAKWTQEVFYFSPMSREGLGYPMGDYSKSLNSLRETLSKKNITSKLIPNWLPDGYECYDINISETPKSTTIVASYQNNQSNELKIQIKAYTAPYLLQIEKGNNFFEIYEASGKEYYIFNNSKVYQAIWTDKKYEIYIAGELSIEQLHKMLDSIEGGT